MLEAELHHAVVSVEDGCPYFRPSTDVKALHHHAEVAKRNKEATGNKQGILLTSAENKIKFSQKKVKENITT